MVGLLALVLHTTLLVDKDAPHASVEPPRGVRLCSAANSYSPSLGTLFSDMNQNLGKKGLLVFSVYGKLTCANILKIFEINKCSFQNSNKLVPTKQMTTIILKFFKEFGEI